MSVKPSQAIDFDVLHVVPNETGSLVALVGLNRCVVLNISKSVRAGLLSKQSALSPSCRAIVLGDRFFSINPTLEIVKARWHPASLRHLALLCSDNTLRLFNTLSGDTEDPEQAFRVVLDQFKVLSFDFGSSMEWSHFTVFYALSDGNLYAQCPVVPLGCPIPDALIESLLTRQAKEIERLEARLARYQQQDQQGDLQKRIRKTIRLIAQAARGLKWAEQLRAGGLKSVPTDRPILQGPLSVSVSDDGEDDMPADERVCDIRVLPTAFPVIFSVYESGLLELRLQVSSVSPAWARKSSATVRKFDALVLFDRLDVAPSIVEGCGSTLLEKDAPLPTFYMDSVQNNFCYISHAGGVECVAIPDLNASFRQLRAIMEREDDDVDLVLPRAEIGPLLRKNLQDNRLIGLFIVATVSGDYFLCYDVEGSDALGVVDLFGKVQSTGVAETRTEDGVTVNEPSVVHEKEAVWVGELRDWAQRPPKMIPRVENLSSGKMTRMQQLTSFIQLTDLYKRHAASLAEGHAILQAGAEDLAARKRAVTEVMDSVGKRLHVVSSKAASVDARVDVVRTNENNLRERVNLLAGLLLSLQPHLTDAERAHHALLRTKEKEITQLEATVDGLQKYVDSHESQLFRRKPRRALAEEEDVSVADERRMALVEETLKDQSARIERLVGLLKDMQIKCPDTK